MNPITDSLLEETPPSAPYPGLRPFRKTEASIFFGREEQTDQLLKKMETSRFLGVVGASGCGKSSLVRAGMIPALGAGFLTGAGGRWRIAEMRPGQQPLANLGEALASPRVLGAGRGDGALALLHATLRRGPLGLVEALRENPLPEHVNLLLLVDQFEEIFRFRKEVDKEEADAFVSLLMETAKQEEEPVYVVITMRSDYLGHCAVFGGLPEMLNDSQFLTPRLTREQCGDAITKPARVFGGLVEPALVTRLLNDMGADPDHLPLLQHCLMRMWTLAHARAVEAGGAARPTVTTDDYRRVGGLDMALSNHANSILGSLEEKQRDIAETMFRRLTERTAGRVEERRDTRRPARLGDVALVADVTPEEVAAVVEEFRRPDRSFLMPPKGVTLTADTLLDISHESLIRLWDTLDGWANEEARSATFYVRLKDTAQLWPEDAELWGGRNLERALEWKKRQKPTAFWAARYGTEEEYARAMLFLEESEKEWEIRERDKREALERERQADIERQTLYERELRLEQEARAARKFKGLSATLALIVLLAIALAVVAFRQTRIAEAKSAEAIAEGRKAAEKSGEAQRERGVAKEKADEAERNLTEAQKQQREAEEQTRLAKTAAEEEKKQRELALRNAREAQRQAAIARANETEAVQLRQQAVKAAEEEAKLRQVAMENEQKAAGALADARKALEERDEAVEELNVALEDSLLAQNDLTVAIERLKKEQQERAEAERKFNDYVASLVSQSDALQANLLDLFVKSTGGNTSPRPAGTGTLQLDLKDVYGRALQVPVAVRLENQVGGKGSTMSLGASGPKLIAGLDAGPKGLYRVDLSAAPYLPVSKFVRVNAGGPATRLEATLAIDASKVKAVEFPAYASLPERVRKILEESNDPVREGRKGEALYVSLHDVEKANLLNVVARMQATQLGGRDVVLKYVKSFNWIALDLVSAEVDDDLKKDIEKAIKDDKETKFKRYQPDDFERLFSLDTSCEYTSYKTTYKYANLRVEFCKLGGKYMVFFGIDDDGGLGEAFLSSRGAVAGGGPPAYGIQQLLVFEGLDPGYKLKWQ